MNWNQFRNKLNPEEIANGNEIADCVDAVKLEFKKLKERLTF